MLSGSGALTPWPGKPPLGMGSPGFPEVSVTDTSESEDKITITHADLGGSILHFYHHFRRQGLSSNQKNTHK